MAARSSDRWDRFRCASKLETSALPTGWLVETMVLDSHRGQAAGSRLMVQAHDEQPFSLSLGQTAEMREIQLRLGWKQVAPLQIAQRVVNPGQVLQGKLPRPAAWAAGLGMKATSRVRGWMDDTVTLSVRPIEAVRRTPRSAVERGRAGRALWRGARRVAC